MIVTTTLSHELHSVLCLRVSNDAMHLLPSMTRMNTRQYIHLLRHPHWHRHSYGHARPQCISHCIARGSGNRTMTPNQLYVKHYAYAHPPVYMPSPLSKTPNLTRGDPTRSQSLDELVPLDITELSGQLKCSVTRVEEAHRRRPNRSCRAIRSARAVHF